MTLWELILVRLILCLIVVSVVLILILLLVILLARLRGRNGFVRTTKKTKRCMLLEMLRRSGRVTGDRFVSLHGWVFGEGSVQVHIC